MARIVGAIYLGALLNAAFSSCWGKGYSEQHILRSLLHIFAPGDLVMGDGYFASYFLLACLLETGVDGVFEQIDVHRRVIDFRRGKRQGPRDADILPGQISFKHAVQVWLAWSQYTQATGYPINEETLFILIVDMYRNLNK